jgi:hypothetical protein
MSDAGGWLYCMVQKGTRCTKFGFTSRTPAERARDGTRGPVPLVVVAAWKSSDARMLERLVLRRLSNCRVNGSEWLQLPVEDIAEVVEQTAHCRGIDIEPAA